MNFKLGEFFCGPGGIAQGAIDSKSIKSLDGKLFSITPGWATDYDLDTCATYAQNIHKKLFKNDKNVIHGDVRKLDIPKLPPCDGFAFGFPCNDFSLVGESKGLNGSYGPLYSYGVEYLKQHNKYFKQVYEEHFVYNLHPERGGFRLMNKTQSLITSVLFYMWH